MDPKQFQIVAGLLENVVEGMGQMSASMSLMAEHQIAGPKDPGVAVSDGQEIKVKGEKGEKGDKGDPGQAPDAVQMVEAVIEQVKPLIPTAEDVAAIALPQIPKPQDGKKGDKGDMPDIEEVAGTLALNPEFLKKTKGDKGDKGDIGPAGKEGSPDTAEEIVRKINAGDFQIDALKIKGIFGNKKSHRQGAGYLKDLSDVEILVEPTGPLVLTWSTTKRMWIPVAVGASGGVPIAIDISSQFDGLTKTFTLPTYSSILMFTLTGWPPNGSLRPTVDFSNPSSTTVMLTSEVSAPAAGSTGIVLIIPA